ncbi:uncharacterized protein LOC141914493 [Tubulanus polymorphus]|uniref:uncharacterized protein LOC141914493 n=1 Tax=Tubulanus polymorphus TaxID=672921 RepID=UPI003DA36639
MESFAVDFPNDVQTQDNSTTKPEIRTQGGWNGGRVFGVVVGILILLILIILILVLFILWRRGCLTCLGQKSEDVIGLLRWTSETWCEKDHENWVKTRDQLQPEMVEIIIDVFGTDVDWELSRDMDKQGKSSEW